MKVVSSPHPPQLLILSSSQEARKWLDHNATGHPALPAEQTPVPEGCPCGRLLPGHTTFLCKKLEDCSLGPGLQHHPPCSWGGGRRQHLSLSAKVDPHGSWLMAGLAGQTWPRCRSQTGQENRILRAWWAKSCKPWPRPTRTQEGPRVVRVCSRRATRGHPERHSLKI